MKRRRVVQALTLTPFGVGIAARAQATAVRIGSLEAVNEVWKDVEFRFANQPCLLVRLPEDRKNPRAFAVTHANTAYNLIAYSRLCTHLGCTTSLPNGERVIGCGCHGSEFSATGDVTAGPANKPLRAIKLELRGTDVYALGWFE